MVKHCNHYLLGGNIFFRYLSISETKSIVLFCQFYFYLLTPPFIATFPGSTKVYLSMKLLQYKVINCITNKRSSKKTSCWWGPETIQNLLHTALRWLDPQVPTVQFSCTTQTGSHHLLIHFLFRWDERWSRSLKIYEHPLFNTKRVKSYVRRIALWQG